jgi:hypothetical protein
MFKEQYNMKSDELCRVQVGRVGLVWFSERNRVESGRIRVESSQVNLYVLFFQIFYRFRLGCMSFSLGSGRSCRVRVGLGRFDFLKNHIGSGSNPDGSDGFLGSGWVLSPIYMLLAFWIMPLNWPVKISRRRRS